MSDTCDAAAAFALAHQVAVMAGGEYQEGVLWQCIDITGPGPLPIVPEHGA